MHVTPARVESERTWVADRATVVVPLIDRPRENLGAAFETDVAGLDDLDAALAAGFHTDCSQSSPYRTPEVGRSSR
ncbi:MAG: hypothetical protein ABEJ47_01080 [Halorhabdus sp.]